MSDKTETIVAGEAEETNTVLVKATAPGFYIKQRLPGDKPFRVPESIFSETWMKKVDAGEQAEAEDAADDGGEQVNPETGEVTEPKSGNEKVTGADESPKTGSAGKGAGKKPEKDTAKKAKKKKSGK